MKIDRDHNIILIFIFIILLLMVFYSKYKLFNLIFLFICTLLLLYDRKLLILIYIIVLPTNGFISTKYNLFGFLYVKYIINLFTTIAVFLQWKHFPAKQKVRLQNLKGLKFYAYYFTLFLMLYLIFTNLRLSLLGLENISTRHLITRPIKYFVMFYPLLIIIKLSIFKDFRHILQKGFVISIFIIATSMIFSKQLASFGFTTQESLEFGEYFLHSSSVRRAGLFITLGDVNSAAGFMAVAFSYILFSSYFNKKYTLILSFLIILSVIASGSRAGTSNLIMVILLYYFSKDINFETKFISIIFFSILIYLLFNYDLINSIIERFSKVSVGEGHLNPENKSGRLGGWVFYINYIVSNLSVLFFGTTENIYKTIGWDYSRVAHNFYIQLFYYWGIFPVLFILSIFIQFLKYARNSVNKYFLLSIFLPFTATLFFVSDTGVFIAFILSLISINKEKANMIYEK